MEGQSGGRGCQRGPGLPVGLGHLLRFYLLRKAQVSRSAVGTQKKPQEIQTLISLVIKTSIKEDTKTEAFFPPFSTTVSHTCSAHISPQPKAAHGSCGLLSLGHSLLWPE